MKKREPGRKVSSFKTEKYAKLLHKNSSVQTLASFTYAA